MRTHAEWNVEIHMPSAASPTSASMRSRISFAALLVKVIARIWLGHASRLAIRPAMRRVSTLVLPEPAPATIRSDPPRCSTAARCCGLSPSSSAVVELRRDLRAPRHGPGSESPSTKVISPRF